MANTSLPSTMTAVGIRAIGGLDAIEQLELPVPKAASDEVIIKMEYAGVNFIDIQCRTGAYPFPVPFPAALGCEGAGTIVSLPTDPKVLENETFKARGLKVGSKVAFFAYAAATFAEYASSKWFLTFVLPENVSTREGAAFLVQGATALAVLTESCPVSTGETVLVHTVAGGVGILLAQVAKARGATVIGTTSTPAKAELARAHGADHVILYKSEDVAARVLELTGGEGAHAIVDGVGKDTFEADLKMVRIHGTIVSLGEASGPIPPFSPRKLSERSIKYSFPSGGNYFRDPVVAAKYMTDLYSRVGAGTLKLPIHAEYPLSAEGVREAQAALGGGASAGKVLIKIA